MGNYKYDAQGSTTGACSGISASGKAFTLRDRMRSPVCFSKIESPSLKGSSCRHIGQIRVYVLLYFTTWKVNLKYPEEYEISPNLKCQQPRSAGVHIKLACLTHRVGRDTECGWEIVTELRFWPLVLHAFCVILAGQKRLNLDLWTNYSALSLVFRKNTFL